MMKSHILIYHNGNEESEVSVIFRSDSVGVRNEVRDGQEIHNLYCIKCRV